ncbi:MAG: hypothetical protein SGARI_001316, partial [Bacillariaceae sp.]
ATGICAAAWFLALIQKKIMGFQYDEVFIGTPEERAAKGHADAENELDMGTFVPGNAVGSHDIQSQYLKLAKADALYSFKREKILSNIKDLREQIKEAETDEEKEAFQSALKCEIESLGRVNNDEMNSSSFRKSAAIDEGVSSEVESDEENQS